MFDANNRVRIEGTRNLVDAALATGARRVVAQSIAFVYAPTGDRVKDEDAPLFTDAAPPFGGVVAAVAELERLVTGSAGIDGLVLRYGLLYGPGTSHDRRGSTAADIIAASRPARRGSDGACTAGCTSRTPRQRPSRRSSAARPGSTTSSTTSRRRNPSGCRRLRGRCAPIRPRRRRTLPPPYAPEMSMHGASNAKVKRELGWRPRYASWREGFAASLA